MQLAWALLLFNFKFWIMEQKEMIVVTLHNEENEIYVSDSVADALEQMWRDDELQDRDGLTFTVADMVLGTENDYEYDGMVFHYCFDHGRINVEQLLRACTWSKCVIRHKK